ncbi:MAG TPA: S8 family serine peptidase [Terriglobia bacterium]|nr:S8 family serine peptidase [Terriglobia bacterium]
MRKLFATLLFLTTAFTSAFASDHVIVELAPGAQPSVVAAAFGGQVERSMQGTNFYLMSVPSAAALVPNPHLGILGVELNSAVSVRPTGAIGILTTSGTKAAEWYAQQPAMKLVNAGKAAGVSSGRGMVIADINSRVDYGHPALIGHLTSGYDFVAEQSGNGATLNQSSASFLDQSSAGFLDQSSAGFLDQSSAGFLDQSTASFLDQSTASFLDQSTASFLDQSNPAHGHGTFCAGLIAALAPDAMIMPLRTFDDTGNADAFTIARAVRYAALNGANVINMSFGMTAKSNAVDQAIKFATDRGVIVVASAGNANTNAPQFPASANHVLGVAATDLSDKKASFSNYGSDVFVDAPGVNIISAYPGGYYAIASGTSFSAPFVSAEAALLHSASWKNSDNAISSGTVNIDAENPGYRNQLGSGRIDMFKALQSQK